MITFAADADDLSPSARATLDDIAARITADPRIAVVRIEGHADDDGTHTDNILLSTRRAKRVRDYLISRGVSQDRLTMRGFGLARPVAEGTAPEARARNRRVELAIDEVAGAP